MFGYINVYKDELKIKDFEVFRSYYCGLCKTLGKKYNQLTRFGLSYDMTFLAILADSINDSTPDIKKEGCLRHSGRQPVCKNNNAIEFSADMSIILTYYKLSDDITDNNSFKARLARIAYKRAVRKSSEKYPDIAEKIRHNLCKLSELERENCAYIDMAADPFATLTSSIFECYDSSLSSLGYNIGRFIYIADAYKDIEEDLEKGSYNPYIAAYDRSFLENDEFKTKVMGSLNMTLAAISACYNKINIKKNKSILDNIIYLGLRSVFDRLFKTSERNENINE
ncbi:MAG: hypothetical protein II998_03450 [Clostridia bacterium]|nr:hypothetical protein [Clostridia bacterium]